MTKNKGIVIATAAALALSGCAGVESKAVFPEDDEVGRPSGVGAEAEPGLFSGSGLTSLFGGDDEQAGGGPNLPVNRHLWRASLDTLAFLPLASTDPFGGVIVTDWGSTAAAPNERFKVTARINSAELKPQSLSVIVNKQTRTNGRDAWLTADVDPSTARKLENAILTRARQIRIAEGDVQ